MLYDVFLRVVLYEGLAIYLCVGGTSTYDRWRGAALDKADRLKAFVFDSGVKMKRAAYGQIVRIIEKLAWGAKNKKGYYMW